MTCYTLGVALRTLWRELTALSVGGLGALLLLLLDPPGAPRAAALALAIGALGAGLVGALTLRQGHLRRALRWPRLCRALRLTPRRLEQARLRPVADAAEEVLATIAGSLPQVQAYLAPARRSALEVLGRALELDSAARRHAGQLRLLERRAPDRALRGVRERLARETDPALREQLEEEARSLRLQLTVGADHREALRRIEGELRAAHRALGAVDATILQADQTLADPARDGRGARPDRVELQDHVSALARAATEVKGEC